jgi:glutathione S-transferase
LIELYSRKETAGTIVQCTLEWAGAPYRLVEVHRGGNGRAWSPENYLALNPRGTVPTIVDGELVLYETAAILEHLVETLPGLGPRAGEPGRSELHFWLAWLSNNLMAAFYRWFKAGEMIEGEGVAALKSGAISDLERHGSWLEQQLSEREWLAGTSPSVADLLMQGLGSWADEIEGLQFGGEAVAAHAARTVALPGVAAALQQDAALSS